MVKTLYVPETSDKFEINTNVDTEGLIRKRRLFKIKGGNNGTLGMSQWEPKKNLKNSSCLVQCLMTHAQFGVVFMNTGNSVPAEDGPSLTLKAEPVSAPVR